MPQKHSPSSVYLNCSPSKRTHQFSKADRFKGSMFNVKSTSNDRLSPGTLREKRNSTALVMLNNNSGADLLGEVDMRAKSTLEPSRNGRSNRTGYESSFGKVKTGGSPFSTTGTRFSYTPAFKKQMNRSPSPGEKLHHESSFKK